MGKERQPLIDLLNALMGIRDLAEASSVLDENASLLTEANVASAVRRATALPDRRAAAAILQRACLAADRVNSLRLRAEARKQFGLALAAIEEFETAAAAQLDAARLFAGAGDIWSEAYSLSRMALCLEDLGRLEDALATFKASAARFHTVGDARGEVLQLGSSGIVLAELGRTDEAVAQHRSAEELAHAHGLAEEEAFNRRKEGQALAAVGRQSEAVIALREALGGYRALGHSDTVGWTLLELARAIRQQAPASPPGDEVITMSREAVVAFVAADDSEAAAGALDQLAEAYLQQGNVKDALQARDDAFNRLKGVVEPGDHVLHLFETALLLERYGHLDEEQRYLDAARGAFEQLGDRDGMAAIDYRRGVFALASEGQEQALPHFEEAAQLWAEANRPGKEALALAMVGSCLAGVGRRDEARKRLENALALSDQGGDQAPAIRIMSLEVLADIDQTEGDLAAAEARLEAALAQMSSPRDPDADIRMKLFEAGLRSDRAAVRRAAGDRDGAFADLDRAVTLLRAAGRERAAVTMEIQLGLQLNRPTETARRAAILRAASAHLLDLVAADSSGEGTGHASFEPDAGGGLAVIERLPDLVTLGLHVFVELVGVNLALGTPDDAVDVAHAGAKVADEAGDHRGAALLGALASMLGESDLDAALTAASAAVASAEAADDRPALGFALHARAEILRRLGELTQAIDDITRSLDIFSSTDDPLGLYSAHRQLGFLARASGELGEAAGHLTKAREFAMVAGLPVAQAEALSGLGLVYTDAGDWQGALDAFAEGLDAIGLANEGGSKGDVLEGVAEAEASIFSNRAGLYRLIGDLQQAEAEYELALDRYRRRGIRLGEAAALGNLGAVRGSMGDLVEARRLTQQSLELHRAFGEVREIATDLLNLGGITAREDNNAAARAAYEEARQLYRRAGFRKGEFQALSNLGLLDVQEGNPVGGQSQLTEAISGLAALHDADTLSYAYHGRSVAKEDLGDLQGALDDSVLALEQLERLHRMLGTPAQRLLLAGRDTAIAPERAVDIASRLHRPVSTLALAERARSRVLTEQLGHAPWPAPAGADPALLEEEAALLARVRAADAAMVSDGEHEPARREQTRAELKAELDAVWDRLAPTAPDYVALRRGEPVRDEDIPGLLHAALDPPPGAKRVGLIQFHTLRDAVVVLSAATGDDAPRLFRVPLGASTLSTRYLGTLQREVRDHPRHQAARLRITDHWQELGPLLLDDALEALGPVDLLYLAPHGPLHYVPLHALNVDQRPLIERLPVAYSPGAATLARINARPSFALQAPVVALGYTDNPRERREFEGEAEDVARLLGGEFRRGREASGQWLISNSGRYRVVHLSCHGRFDERDPLASGLLLADGLLTARQLMAFRFDGALVTLSACDTGVSETLKGDEVMGLNRSLLLAGVTTAVLTLWPVDAVATRAAMNAFYRRLSEADRPGPAVALQAAILAVRDTHGWEHPYYWAPFASIGHAGAVPISHP